MAVFKIWSFIECSGSEEMYFLTTQLQLDNPRAWNDMGRHDSRSSGIHREKYYLLPRRNFIPIILHGNQDGMAYKSFAIQTISQQWLIDTHTVANTRECCTYTLHSGVCKDWLSCSLSHPILRPTGTIASTRMILGIFSSKCRQQMPRGLDPNM